MSNPGLASEPEHTSRWSTFTSWLKRTSHKSLLFVHTWLVASTWILLFLALALAIYWVASPTVERLEPAITTVGLVAAIIGLLIDRWLTEHERKRQIIRSLLFEVSFNRKILSDSILSAPPTPADAFKAFPRPTTATFEMAISSGMFTEKTDLLLLSEIFSTMFATIHLRDDFLAFEVRMLVGSEKDYPNIRKKVTDSAQVRDTRNRTESLYKKLNEYYQREFATPLGFEVEVAKGTPPE